MSRRPWWRRGRCALGLGLGLGLWALTGGSAAAAKRRAPRSGVVPPALIDSAVAEASTACRETLRQALGRGEQPPLARGCRGDLDRIALELSRQRPVFGVVERRLIDPGAIRMVLWTARRCQRWLLRPPERGVLFLVDAYAAKCEIRRFTRPLAIGVVDARGARSELLELLPGDDGRYLLDFGAVVAVLDHRGLPPLTSWVRIELGPGGWAGTIDVAALHRELAAAHGDWVRGGRGLPGLFVHRHPDHEAADDARLLEESRRLARTQRDYAAVLAGALAPEEFLRRYLRSRFHPAVEALARRQATSESAAQGGIPGASSEGLARLPGSQAGSEAESLRGSQAGSQAGSRPGEPELDSLCDARDVEACASPPSPPPPPDPRP